MLTAFTKSGAVYELVGHTPKGTPKFSRNGGEPKSYVGIFPDRLPMFQATVKWGKEGNALAGYNSRGVRTLLFMPDQIRAGMFLINPDGSRSTEIVRVVRG